MMKLYAVRDKVMERCAPPFAAPNHATAMRVFKNLGFPKESPISDFELVFVGDFDETEKYESIMDGSKVMLLRQEQNLKDAVVPEVEGG